MKKRKKPITITPEIKAEIIRLYVEEKMNQNEICDQLELSAGAVNNHLKGIEKRKRVKRPKPEPVFYKDEPVKPKKEKPNRHDEIKKLWLDGYSKSKICQKLGMGYTTVDKAIIAMGIEDMQEVKKLKSIHPTKGKIPMTVPGVKGTYYVRPEKLESFKEKYKIA